MLHFIGASIVWWLGVCAPLLLAMSRFSSGEYLDSAVSCALALALTPYAICYLEWAGSRLPQTDFIPIYG